MFTSLLLLIGWACSVIITGAITPRWSDYPLIHFPREEAFAFTKPALTLNHEVKRLPGTECNAAAGGNVIWTDDMHGQYFKYSISLPARVEEKERWVFFNPVLGVSDRGGVSFSHWGAHHGQEHPTNAPWWKIQITFWLTAKLTNDSKLLYLYIQYICS